MDKNEVPLESINVAYERDNDEKEDDDVVGNLEQNQNNKEKLNMRYSVAANNAVINTQINTRTNGQVLKNYSWVRKS